MMGYKTIGNTVAEWNDEAPLVFWLSEEVGRSDARHLKTATFDLSDLRAGFTDAFLLHFKDRLIDWRNRVSVTSLESYIQNLQGLFRRVIALKLLDARIDVIDEPFLLSLDLAKERVPQPYLRTLKNAFTTAPHSPMWARGLHASDFPLTEQKKGFYGQQISRILAQALSRAACVNILSRCERAYDLGEMDVGHFAFVNLAFAVYCRPESYRQIQLCDLVFDEKSHAYFLYVVPAKSGVVNPAKIAYKINEAIGVLLQKQRQSVVSQYGHLVCHQDISKLALFPARGLSKDKARWRHADANKHFGMYGTRDAFCGGYPRGIKKAFLASGPTIGANVLRHTVGTQLAQSGASAQTIQAVLKHATDTVCRAYVDIAFQGLIGALSDAMQPAFEMHLPVFTRFRSMLDPMEAEQAIRSDDPETGQIELTGECGKEIQCEFAPISCYGCVHFIPCWDADHGVNLKTVEQEIEDFKRRGKPFEHMVEKAKVAKYNIVLTMNAVDRYLQGCAQEPHHEQPH